MSGNDDYAAEQLEKLLSAAIDRGGFPPLPEPMAPGIYFFAGETALLLIDAGRQLYLRSDGKLAWLVWHEKNDYHPLTGNIPATPEWSEIRAAQLISEHRAHAAGALKNFLESRNR